MLYLPQHRIGMWSLSFYEHCIWNGNKIILWEIPITYEFQIHHLQLIPRILELKSWSICVQDEIKDDNMGW